MHASRVILLYIPYAILFIYSDILIQGSVGTAGGAKNGTVGKPVGVSGPKGVVAKGGNLYSGYSVMGGKIGVVRNGGSSTPGIVGKLEGVCRRRRAAPRVTSMLENDRVMKKARVMKFEAAIGVLENDKVKFRIGENGKRGKVTLIGL